MTVVGREVELLPHQYAALQAFEEGDDWVGMITGSGAGKTWFGARWLVSRATRFTKGFHLGTEPSDDQLDLVMKPAISAALDEIEMDHRFNNSLGCFELGNGGRILVRTASTFELKRGVEIDSWWADEARDYKSKVFEVTFPGRIRGRFSDVPQVLVTTTPNGYDHVYRRFGQTPPLAGHRLIHARSRDNPHNRADFVPKLLRNIDEDVARQEEGGEFIDLRGGQVYKAFRRSEQVKPCEYDPGLELGLAFDFNVTPFICEIVQPAVYVFTDPPVSKGSLPRRRVEPGAKVIGEIVLRPGDIGSMADAIRKRYGDHEREVTIFGDSTGHNRTSQTGKTSYAMLEEALDRVFRQGVAVEVPRDQPAVIDRINSVNTMLRNGLGEGHLLIDPSCTWLVRDLEQVRWDELDRIEKEDKKLTHASDALGYFVHRRFRPATRETSREELEAFAR